MNPDMQKELFARLDAMAAKLGVAAGYLWQTLIRQARVEAILDTFWACVCLSVLVAIAVCWGRLMTWIDEDHDRGLALLPVGVAFVTALVPLFYLVSDAMTEWFNPGYYAWNTLMDKLR